MYKLFRLLSLTSIIMTFPSCQSNKVIVQPVNIEDQASQLLDPPITLIYNIDSTYVLCLGVGSSRTNPLSKSYCVFDNFGNLLSERRTIHGNVGWYKKETLILESIPRVINKRDGQISVISYYKINKANAKSK